MRLTASRIALARHCAWWARPDVEVPAGEASTAAELGTALHAVAEQESEEVDGELVDETFRHLTWQAGALEPEMGLEEAASPSRELAASLPPADRVALEQLVAAWRAWWATWSKDVEVLGREVPFAIDVATGRARQLPSKGQRDYSDATPTEIPGTTDLVARRAGRLIVLDYKTGFAPHRYRDHEEQMRFQGAAAALAAGEHEVLVIVAHVTADGVRLEERVLDSLDVAVIVHELRELAAEIVGAVANPGIHCDDEWCPALSVCTETRRLLATGEMSIDARRRLPVLGPARTNDEAFAKHLAARALEALVKRFDAEAKAFADEHQGIRAPDGRVYRKRVIPRESPKIEVNGAVEALTSVLGPDGADEAIEVKTSTSWAAIKRVARARGMAIEETEEHARAALREAGALKTSEIKTYGWKAEKQ